MKFKKGDFIKCKKGIEKYRYHDIEPDKTICIVCSVRKDEIEIVPYIHGRLWGLKYIVDETDFEYAVPRLHEGIEPGYVCRLRNGKNYILYVFIKNGTEEIALAGDQDILVCYRVDLTHEHDKEYDIMKVYGYSSSAYNINEPDMICYRDLIWKRQEAKKMTVKEIAEALGYEVEIIEG